MGARRRLHNQNEVDSVPSDASVHIDDHDRSHRKRHRERSARQAKSVPMLTPRTIQAAAILSVAILVAALWNWLDDSVDPAVRSLLQQVCLHSEDAYCHTALVPARRTQKAVKPIKAGEVVLEIPRHLQIWDLDALRSPAVHRLLLARITSGNGDQVPLPSAAFLAAHLALLLNVQHENGANVPQDLDPMLSLYLRVLPTFTDFQGFHPLAWSRDYLANTVGTYTSTYTHTMAFYQLLRDEYLAFCGASTDFCKQISLEDYLAARLNVLTRSFGTGELHAHHELVTHRNTTGQFSSWKDEVAYYEQTSGVLLSRGSHAMVPILDLYDHHAKPNVGFSYDSHKRAFVVSAISPIGAGYDVMDSYGKRTDSVGIGRNRRAVPHQERTMVLRYLQYDDGYEKCVGPEDKTDAWEFKKLKYEYLLATCTQESRWVFHMSPRDKLSSPAPSTEQPITLQAPSSLEMRSLRFDGTVIFGTCRLLSLTHLDYGGNATAMLREALDEQQSIERDQPFSTIDRSSSDKQSMPYVLPPTRDGLEYRTLLCIARMASTALNRFGVSVSEQQAVVAQLNRDAFQSHKWTVAHLRLGEMQSLEMLKEVAFLGLRRLFGVLEEKDNDPTYRMRDKPCPPQYWRPLLKP
jgi:hypothetical protein